MLVQQAIFTSVRSGRNEGYQLAARSSGISEREARELAQWGPGHDSVYTELPAGESVNCHTLESGEFCISQTVLAGREYSGRGGQRVYTHMFLVPGAVLLRFGNSPFRVIESLVVSGRLTVQQSIPEELAPITLVGRASLVNLANLRHVARKIGAKKLAAAVQAALSSELLGVSADVSGKRLFGALIDLLPLSSRIDYSFTTGLKASTTRRYRLVVLPPQPEEHRRAIRQIRLDVLDLTSEVPARFDPESGWPQLVHQLLRSEQYETLAKVVDETAHCTQEDLDLFAERQRERLVKDSEQAVLTPFSA